jgi:hypothetical protein
LYSGADSWRTAENEDDMFMHYRMEIHMKQKALNREENSCKATRTMNKIYIAGAILKV